MIATFIFFLFLAKKNVFVIFYTNRNLQEENDTIEHLKVIK
jgi:hypothetical protein